MLSIPIKFLVISFSISSAIFSMVKSLPEYLSSINLIAIPIVFICSPSTICSTDFKSIFSLLIDNPSFPNVLILIPLGPSEIEPLSKTLPKSILISKSSLKLTFPLLNSFALAVTSYGS